MTVLKQLNIGENSINYSLKGSGSAIVLLHGFLENILAWKEVEEYAVETENLRKTCNISSAEGINAINHFFKKHDKE